MSLRFPALLGVAMALCGCTGLQVASRWRQQEISVDGLDKDWREVDGAKTQGLTVRAANDAEALYLCITADEADLQRQLAGTDPWTLRFRALGGQESPWSLRLQRKFILHPIDPSQREQAAQDPGAETELSLVGGPGGDPAGRPLEPSDGISFAGHELYGTLVLEFKLALHADKDHRVALNAGPGDTLGLSLVLPAAPRGPQHAGGHSGGDRRHSSGHGGGMRGGGPGGVPGSLGGPPALGADPFGGIASMDPAANKPPQEPGDDQNAPEGFSPGAEASVISGALTLAKPPRPRP